MQIETFVLGGFQVSAYAVVEGDAAMIVDAPKGAEAIADWLRERDLVPERLVNTHGHVDHIAANGAIRETWPETEIVCGADEAPLLASPMKNMSILMGQMVKSPPPDRTVADGDEITLGEATFTVLETPGHSPGSISLYSPAGPDGKPVVFTGDALFAGSIGRTDFPGMSQEKLVGAIREKLFALPDETVVYPGHGPATTIGDEKAGNPYV